MTCRLDEVLDRLAAASDSAAALAAAVTVAATCTGCDAPAGLAGESKSSFVSDCSMVSHSAAATARATRPILAGDDRLPDTRASFEKSTTLLPAPLAVDPFSAPALAAQPGRDSSPKAHAADSCDGSQVETAGGRRGGGKEKPVHTTSAINCLAVVDRSPEGRVQDRKQDTRGTTLEACTDEADSQAMTERAACRGSVQAKEQIARTALVGAGPLLHKGGTPFPVSRIAAGNSKTSRQQNRQEGQKEEYSHNRLLSSPHIEPDCGPARVLEVAKLKLGLQSEGQQNKAPAPRSAPEQSAQRDSTDPVAAVIVNARASAAAEIKEDSDTDVREQLLPDLSTLHSVSLGSLVGGATGADEGACSSLDQNTGRINGVLCRCNGERGAHNVQAAAASCLGRWWTPADHRCGASDWDVPAADVLSAPCSNQRSMFAEPAMALYRRASYSAGLPANRIGSRLGLRRLTSSGSLHSGPLSYLDADCGQEPGDWADPPAA